MDIKIGCDPEFFVKKDGQFVSAHGLIAGTKYNPQRVEDGAIQVDGMALEFNINPATTADEFLNNINSVMTQFRAIIPPEYEFVFEPVATFSHEYMATQPIEATELGCTPDYNAWTGQVNSKPSADVPFRTASGHIHIGWTDDVDPYDPEHFEACCMVVKQLDNSLGIAEQFWDTDTVRKSLYGAPGAFRPKSYGVEYRVLSNAWLRDPALTKFIFTSVVKEVNKLKAGDKLFKDSSTHSSSRHYNLTDNWYTVKDRLLDGADKFVYSLLAKTYSDILSARDLERQKKELAYWNTINELAPATMPLFTTISSQTYYKDDPVGGITLTPINTVKHFKKLDKTITGIQLKNKKKFGGAW